MGRREKEGKGEGRGRGRREVKRGRGEERGMGREGGEEEEASSPPIPHRMDHVYILAIALHFPFTQHCFSDTALDSRLVVATVVTCRSHHISME